MIHAIYKHDEQAGAFYVTFSNVPLDFPDYKPVNATYHLENAILKALRTADENGKLPSYFVVKVTDPKNDYLKLLAIAFVQFIKGAGIANVNREGF
jgi:hypothetical protein